MRASRMIARWENHITLSYAKQSLVKFFITLLFTSHLMACIWGLLGNFFLDLATRTARSRGSSPASMDFHNEFAQHISLMGTPKSIDFP